MGYVLKIKNEHGGWVHIPALTGASAYETAVEKGFEGTEEEWLESLKGEPGVQGIQGDKGDKGDDGQTPQKGVDYFTAEEKQELASEVERKLKAETDTLLAEKVPTSRKVNGKELSEDITLSAEDVGADASGSAAAALEDAKQYADREIAEFDFIKIVEELPEAGLANRLYLVPKSGTQENDLFDEYIWANDSWEFIATKQVEVDLANYVKNTDMEKGLDSIIAVYEELINAVEIEAEEVPDTELGDVVFQW